MAEIEAANDEPWQDHWIPMATGDEVAVVIPMIKLLPQTLEAVSVVAMGAVVNISM